MKLGISCALFAAFGALGCDVDSVEPIVGCESLSECPLGQICDPDKSKCVPEPDARFVGAFKCFVHEKGDKPQGLPGSEVIGRLGEDRWTLPVGGVCQLNDNGFLIVTLAQTSGDEALTLSIAPESVKDGGRVRLGDMHQVEGDWALFSDPGANFAIAYSAGGYVRFEDDIQAGELVSAYLDVRVVPAIDEEVVLGVRCPHGDVDCGYSLDSRAPFCLEHDLDDSETLSVCTTFCESDADCGFAGGSCFLGFCALPCQNDRDCPDSYCFSSSEGAFCF